MISSTQRRKPRSRSRSRPSRSPRRRSASPRAEHRHSTRRSRSSRSPSRESRSRERSKASSDPFARSLGGPMNAPHEEAVEFAKISKRENRVYVGNLSYDVKYRDLMEFMRGGGWGNLISLCKMWRGRARSATHVLLNLARFGERLRAESELRTRGVCGCSPFQIFFFFCGFGWSE